jgi:hypothetical protein
MEVNASQSKISKMLAWIVAGLSTVAGVFWAVITYVFPDPSILGLEVVNWKNFLSVCATFVFMSVVIIAIKARSFPVYVRGTLNLVLAVALSAAFFEIGKEYAKPSFEFAQDQQKNIENDSATLLGKRIEMVDNVRISLLDCRVVAQTPSCTFEFTSTNADREIGFSTETRFFEPNGGALRIDRVVLGNQPITRISDIELVRNLVTKVTLVFEPTRENIKTIPSVKLVMQGWENGRQVIKFNEVAAL